MKTITPNQIQEALAAIGAGMATFEPNDELYSEPAKEWVTGEFATDLHKNLEALGLATYQPIQNDCDDFARTAWDMACKSHSRTPREPGQPATALAFGMFRYLVGGDPHKPHVINFFINGELIYFFEPQTQELVALTPAEMESCFGVDV